MFGEAEEIAIKAGDHFVPAERFLTALAIVNSGAKDALGAGRVSAQALNSAINDIRKGRTADSANAEEGYDALGKYAQDLTEAARDGNIDPIIGRDDEIRRAMQVLSRRTKNNPVLIGEPVLVKRPSPKEWHCALLMEMSQNPCATKTDGAGHGRIDCGCQVSR